jgi:rod shape-determining protein MreC
MIRLSIQARQALAKLTLPVLIVASFGLMLLGKADALLAERARAALFDAMAPIYAVLAEPLGALHATVTEVGGLWDLRTENARLREENERLRRWQSVALALDAENQRLKASLAWVPDPDASFITARVVADAGGVYARAVLLAVGPSHGIRKGEIAVDERGLVGRITDVGARTARVLLITDLNSRIPVVIESTRDRAVLAGDNTVRPRLLYLSPDARLSPGDRVLTSGHGGALPAGLPVGVIAEVGERGVLVQPYVDWARLDYVRLLDYGLTGILPSVPAPPPAKAGRKSG